MTDPMWTVETVCNTIAIGFVIFYAVVLLSTLKGDKEQMKKRTLEEWIQAMKLCRDNDMAFSVSGPGLIEMIDTMVDVRQKIFNLELDRHSLQKKVNADTK